jgi:riboflavin biosynthesis pyrimidine reductase
MYRQVSPEGDQSAPDPTVAREELHRLHGPVPQHRRGRCTKARRAATMAAGDKNILVHSPDIARQLIRSRLVDEIHLHVVPIFLDDGGRLFEDTGRPGRGWS